jgi:hypothetical protein
MDIVFIAWKNSVFILGIASGKYNPRSGAIPLRTA